MHTREKLSVLLVVSGIILALVPLPDKITYMATPSGVLQISSEKETFLTADQVARLIVNSDSTIQLIDLRSPDEFRRLSLPGAVNVPVNELLSKNSASLLPGVGIKKIFYSNGDFDSNIAFVAASGQGTGNLCVMKGGLNSWFESVMNSTFSGEKISARENAIFETRYKARRLFTEINSLPDSVKIARLKSKRFDPKKLDGGCE